MRFASPPALFLVLLCLALGISSCSEGSSSRKEMLRTALIDADLQMLRTRPVLVEGKYGRMALGLFEYFRGSLPIYLADARSRADYFPPSSYFSAPEVVPALGDPHVENFGTMRAYDGSFALEPNDFDAADMWPFLWDLRRLLVAMVIAGRESNLDDDEARAEAIAEDESYARAAIESYVTTIHALAEGAAPTRVVEHADQGTVLADAFSRSHRDEADRRELGTFTEIVGDTRLLIRGPVEGEASNTLQDLPPFARDSLPALLDAYRRTLVVAYPAHYFDVLDAAREFGSGVASWPRVRVLVLIDGPSSAREDDLLIEIKETVDSGALGWTPPGPIARNNTDRIRTMSRGIWARPDADPLLSAVEWLGIPVLIRTSSDAFKTLRVSRLVGSRGTPDALRTMSAALGALLARIHASPLSLARGSVGAIDRIAQSDAQGFIAEESAFAVRYADQVASDFELFREMLAESGPRLGFRANPNDAQQAETTLLFGVPTTPIPVTP